MPFYPGKLLLTRLQDLHREPTTDVITAHGAAGDDHSFGGDLPGPIVAGWILYVRDDHRHQDAGDCGRRSLTRTRTLTVFRNDPEQGIDPIFLQDHNHSNTAWIRVECPSGSEVGIPDANTKDNPPVDHVGIYECQLGDIYDEIGEIAATDQYLTNPADVLAFGCMEIRKYPSSRVDWESLDTLR